MICKLLEHIPLFRGKTALRKSILCFFLFISVSLLTLVAEWFEWYNFIIIWFRRVRVDSSRKLTLRIRFRINFEIIYSRTLITFLILYLRNASCRSDTLSVSQLRVRKIKHQRFRTTHQVCHSDTPEHHFRKRKLNTSKCVSPTHQCVACTASNQHIQVCHRDTPFVSTRHRVFGFWYRARDALRCVGVTQLCLWA